MAGVFENLFMRNAGGVGLSESDLVCEVSEARRIERFGCAFRGPANQAPTPLGTTLQYKRTLTTYEILYLPGKDPCERFSASCVCTLGYRRCSCPNHSAN